MYDLSLQRELTSAISKVKAVFIGKNFANIIKSSSVMDLQVALVNQQCVKISYESPDAKLTERIIEPFSFYHNPR